MTPLTLELIVEQICLNIGYTALIYSLIKFFLLKIWLILSPFVIISWMQVYQLQVELKKKKKKKKKR